MGDVVSNVVGTFTGSNAKEAGQQAANTSLEAAQLVAGGQKEALQYLQQQDKLPTQVREGALQQLAGFFGLPGGSGDQQSFVSKAMSSPIYSNLLQQGEQGVLRNASATGGLRSGNVQEALATNSQDALMSVINQQLSGITGLASMPSNAGAIANMMVAPSSTIAEGMIAGSQAQQAAAQNQQNAMMGLLGAGAMAFSDIRAKENIRYIGEYKGHSWFEWDWNDLAEEQLGLRGSSQGVMAHFVAETHPHAIKTVDGLLCVDYEVLGFTREDIGYAQ